MPPVARGVQDNRKTPIRTLHAPQLLLCKASSTHLPAKSVRLLLRRSSSKERTAISSRSASHRTRGIRQTLFRSFSNALPQPRAVQMALFATTHLGCRAAKASSWAGESFFRKAPDLSWRTRASGRPALPDQSRQGQIWAWMPFLTVMPSANITLAQYDAVARRHPYHQQSRFQRSDWLSGPENFIQPISQTLEQETRREQFPEIPLPIFLV